MAAVHPHAEVGAHVDAAAPAAEAERVTGYGAAETIDRAATPLPDAVARTHPDGIDVLADVASVGWAPPRPGSVHARPWPCWPRRRPRACCSPARTPPSSAG